MMGLFVSADRPALVLSSPTSSTAPSANVASSGGIPLWTVSNRRTMSIRTGIHSSGTSSPPRRVYRGRGMTGGTIITGTNAAATAAAAAVMSSSSTSRSSSPTSRSRSLAEYRSNNNIEQHLAEQEVKEFKSKSTTKIESPRQRQYWISHFQQQHRLLLILLLVVVMFVIVEVFLVDQFFLGPNATIIASRNVGGGKLVMMHKLPMKMKYQLPTAAQVTVPTLLRRLREEEQKQDRFNGIPAYDTDTDTKVGRFH